MKKKFIIPLLLLIMFQNPLTGSAQTPASMGAILDVDGRFEIYVAVAGDNGGVYQTIQIVPNGAWLSSWNSFQPTPDYLAHGLVAGRDQAGRSLVAWISNGDIFVAAAKKPNNVLTIGSSGPTFPKQSEGGVQFRFNYLQIANRPDGMIELLALNERGRVFSMIELPENPAASSMTFTNPVNIGGGLLQSISVTKLLGGLALVATGKDKKVWLKSQTMPGVWDHDPWTDLGGNQIERAYAQESSMHQLEVVALGGDRSLYLQFQNVGTVGAASLSGWRMILDQQKAGRRSPAIFFDRFKDGSLFVVSHFDHGNTQFVGTFGKTFQLPNNGDWTGIQFTYNAPAQLTNTFDFLSPKAITMIKGVDGSIHYFVCENTVPVVKHFVDFGGATDQRELIEGSVQNQIPNLPLNTISKRDDAPEN